MAEPLRSNPVEHLWNLVRMILSVVSHREVLSRIKNILQEMRSATLRHDLQEETSKLYCVAANIRALAKGLAEIIETNLIFAAVRIGTLVDLQPLYFSDTALSPVLPCTRL
jgi:hypothetical protein